MKKTIAVVCALFALSAVSTFAEENGADTQTDATQQTADQKAEAAKKAKKQVDEKARESHEGSTSGAGSSELK